MSRNSNVRFVKPRLEELEERAQPSFLLGTNAVQQLAEPLNNMVTDMNNAATDLKAQFAAIQANNAASGTNTYAGAEKVETMAVGDWQRILNDSAAIKATVNADMNFIQTAAFAEFQAGDSLDLAVLLFGHFVGLEPTKPLSDAVTQATDIFNDPTLQNIVGTNLHTVNFHVENTTPISGVTVPPKF